MNAAVNLLLIVLAVILLSTVMFRDTSISKLPDQGSLHKTVLAAGWFWGVEAALQRIDGVKHATSGYTGGSTKDPTYRDVCGGRTGHAEAVQVLFDPKVVSFKDLIRHYLKLFKPSRYQGEETSQYRAAIFYESEQQKREAGEVLAEMSFDKKESELLLEPASTFFAAEVYHQKYYEKTKIGGLRW